MVIKCWNPRTKAYEPVSCTEASEIRVNSPSFASKTVAGALQELDNRMKIAQRNIAYIYQMGTLGGGGNGSGSGSGSGSTAGDHVIVPINFTESGTTYFESGQNVVLKFTIRTALNGKFNIMASSSYKSITTVGRSGSVVSLNMGILPVGTYQIAITGSTASGATLDPTTITIRVAKLAIESNFDDSVPYLPSEIIRIAVNCYSDYSADLTLIYTIDGGQRTVVTAADGLVKNGTTTLQFNTNKNWSVGTHSISMTLWTKDESGGDLQMTNPKVFDIKVASNQLMVTFSSTNPTEVTTSGDLNLEYSIVRATAGVFNLYYEVYNEAGTHISGSRIVGDTLTEIGLGQPYAINLNLGTYQFSLPVSSLGVSAGKYFIRLHVKSVEGNDESLGDARWGLDVVDNTSFVPLEPVNKMNLVAWFSASYPNSSESSWVNQIENSPITCDLFYCDASKTGVLTSKRVCVFSGGSYGRINYAPFAASESNLQNGLTIEITYKATATGNTSARIVDCASYSQDDEFEQGLTITEDTMALRTSLTSIETEVADDTWITATYVLQNGSVGKRLYIDGTITKYGNSDATAGSQVDRTDLDEYIYLGCRHLQSGKFSYTHIVYADNDKGENFSNVPSYYVGVCTNQNPVSPTSPAAYGWHLVQGVLPTDDNFHVAYADDLDGTGFNHNSGRYVGYYFSTDPDPSEDYRSYQWQLCGGTDVLDFSDCEIHDIKIYQTALTNSQVVSNFVSVDYSSPKNLYDNNGNRRSDEDRISINTKLRTLNGIVDNEGTFSPDISSNSPYPIVYITFDDYPTLRDFWTWSESTDKTSTSGDPFHEFQCNIQYSDPNNYGISWAEPIPGTIKLQGTTSLMYSSKNYDISYGNDANGRPILFTPRPVELNNEPIWLGENSHTLKCDMMDSSHANNVGNARLMNDFFDGEYYKQVNHPTQYPSPIAATNAGYPPRKLGSENNPNHQHIKNAIVGFPCMLVIEDSRAREGQQDDRYQKYMGIYMFDTGRTSVYNLGLEAYTVDEDFAENTTDGLMYYGQDYDFYRDKPNSIYKSSRTEGTIYAWEADSSNNLGATAFNQYSDNWIQREWTPRYPLNDAFVSSPRSLEYLKRIIQMTSNAYKEFDNSVDYVLLSSAEGTSVEYAERDSNGDPIVQFDPTKNTILRWAAEDDGFIVWNKSSLLDYYIGMLLLGLSDSAGKNFIVKTWEGETNSSGVYIPHAYATPYDLDTALGKDNVGNYDANLGPDMNFDSEYAIESDSERGWNGYTESLFKTSGALPIGSLGNIIPIVTNTTGRGLGKGHGYNLSKSRLWELLRRNEWNRDNKETAPETTGLSQDISLKARWMYYRKAGVINIDRLMSNYKYIIDNIGANYYNEDAEIRYLQKINTRSFLHGTMIYYTKAWLQRRIQYLDSMFEYSDNTVSDNTMGSSFQIRFNPRTQSEVGTVAVLTIRTKYPMFIPVTGETSNTGEDNYSVMTRPDKNTYLAYTISAGTKPFNIFGAKMITELEGVNKYNPSYFKVEGGANNLTKLDLSGCTRLQTDLDLTLCSALIELNLSGCTNLVNPDLTGCTRLQRLDISNTSAITTIDITSGAMRYLNISNSKLVTLTLKNQKFLENVDFSSCKTLRTLIIENTAMKHLNIPSCNLNDIQISNCPGLESIEIDGCRLLTKVTVLNCPEIKKVSITNCDNTGFAICDDFYESQLSDIQISQMVTRSVNLSGCTNLEDLNFSGSACQVVTLNGALTSLKTLNINTSGVRQFIFTAAGDYIRVTAPMLRHKMDISEAYYPALDLKNFPSVYPQYNESSKVAAILNVNWTTVAQPLAIGGELIRITGQVVYNRLNLTKLASDSPRFQFNPWYRLSGTDEQKATIATGTDAQLKAALDDQDENDILYLTMTSVNNIGQIFENCDSLTMLDLQYVMFKLKNCEVINHGVKGCVKIKGNITKDLFKNNTALKELHYMFEDCNLQSGTPIYRTETFRGNDGVTYVFDDNESPGYVCWHAIGSPTEVMLDVVAPAEFLAYWLEFNMTYPMYDKRNPPMQVSAGYYYSDAISELVNLVDCSYAFFGDNGLLEYRNASGGEHGDRSPIEFNAKLESCAYMFSRSEGDGAGAKGKFMQARFKGETFYGASLFVNNPKLVDVSGMFAFTGAKIQFSATSNMFSHNSFIENTSYMFAECEIAGTAAFDDLFGCNQTTTAAKNNYPFSTIKDISGMFLKTTGWSNIQLTESMFSGLVNLESIDRLFAESEIACSVPNNLFKDDVALTSANYVFANSDISGMIPEGVFEGCSNIISFTACFLECEYITGLEGTILEGMPNLTDVANMFQGCVNILSITGPIIIDCPKLRNFTNVFQGCNKMTTVTGPLITSTNGQTIKVESVMAIFGGCSALTEITDPFAGLTEVTSVNQAFNESGITSIPEGLFDDCTKLTDITGVFKGCTSLSVAESDRPFQNCPRIVEAASVFEGCSVISSCPALLSGCTKIRTLKAFFADCSALARIDVHFFDGLTSVTDLSEMFKGTQITFSSSNAISNNGQPLPTVETIESMFEGITSALDLSTINLLQYLTGLRNMNTLFYNSSLAKVSDNFMNTIGGNNAATQITEMKGMFEATKNAVYTGGTTVFAGVDFMNKFPNVTDLSYFFDNSNIVNEKTISDTVFNNLTKLTTITYMFRGSGIATIPSKCFYGCSQLSEARGFAAYCTKLTSCAPDAFSLFNSATNPNGNVLRNVYGAFYKSTNCRVTPPLWDPNEFNIIGDTNLAGMYHQSIDQDGTLHGIAYFTLNEATIKQNANYSDIVIQPLMYFYQDRATADSGWIGDFYIGIGQEDQGTTIPIEDIQNGNY